MKDIIADNKPLIDHVEYLIKPLFKSCKVHVSNMDNTINIDVGLISNVLHTTGHDAIPDPLKLSMNISVTADKNGITSYRLEVDRYIIHLKDDKVFNGLCCCLMQGTYVQLIDAMHGWITAVYINVNNHKDKLHIRDDIKHLYL